MLAIYEWMALREALDDPGGAAVLAPAIYDLVHGREAFGTRLERFTHVIDGVPQRQTRLAKWPVVTLFPFVARPRSYLIAKPRTVRRAAEGLGFDLAYASRPNAATYGALMTYVAWLRDELAAWKPRDLIDLQSFLWVTQSEEYEE